MIILGISGFYHDSAAALIEDGLVIAAAQEERFTRVKHDSSFPIEASKYCLNQAGINIDDVDSIVFYEKPFLKFDRLIETYSSMAPRGFQSFAMALPVWLKEKLFQKNLLVSELENLPGAESKRALREKIFFSEHHLSHAASAFYPSGFEDAAILTMDGVGEWTTTSLAIGSGSDIEILREIKFPHSLGLLYSAFTYYTGFKVNSGEYKLMGLAPYGKPRYRELITENLIEIAEDGTFHLDQTYFDYCTGAKMTSQKFHDLFGGPPRVPESPIQQRDMDLAASIQVVCEDIVVKLGKSVRKTTGQNNLCLAGGVALNCVANGVLARERIFEHIWIQPASGDAGGSIGAALALYHMHHKRPRKTIGRDQMAGSYLGPSYSDEEVESSLIADGAVFHKLDWKTLIDTTVDQLVSGSAIGWFQGRMEFGPRALGRRSILCDARSPETQKQLNLKVKFRESFRPFAPSVLCEHVDAWFENVGTSPYMLMVGRVNKNRLTEPDAADLERFGIDQLNVTRSEIPAVTHVDYSARVQTVHKDTNPEYYDLLTKFLETTGCPLLVNTSFNVRNEPIVCTPHDAFRCFMGTELDCLVIGNFILYKHEQAFIDRVEYYSEYEMD